jgi:hypothetical protein
MKSILKLMSILNALFLLLSIAGQSAAADLIEPSRTLKTAPAEPGNLAVLSEPPNLNVNLNNELIGTTPLFVKSLKSGTYQLRVADSETTIYVEPGSTLQISLFKGEFISTATREKEPVEQQAAQEKKVGETRITQQAAKEEQKNELSPWDRFVNKSSSHF